MITCKDLDIPLCLWCSWKGGGCYIGYYKRHIADHYLYSSTKDIIELYNKLYQEDQTDIIIAGRNYSFYFLKTLETYHPKIFQLMILA